MVNLWFDESQLPCLCNYGLPCDCDEQDLAVAGVGHFVFREEDDEEESEGMYGSRN